MHQVSNIDSLWIPREAANVLARNLQAEGFNVTATECNEYAMNVIRLIAGGDGHTQRVVRDLIAEVLDVEEVR